MEKLKYLGVTVINTNDIRKEIKRRINMGNACYYSLEKILSSHLLSKKMKVNTYKTIILLVVLYGHENWFPALREEHRLRVFENKVFKGAIGEISVILVKNYFFMLLHTFNLHNPIYDSLKFQT